ncbi:MAG: hypothetical protein A2Y15_04690 [Clostridiales bacterium GWF2_36_10]|nr:MAG: hypothetical protein A2Y15_04690 [Clostridiales bacterium GWF2_36_10]HAN20870.1 hypothetical protein [Clostridiales bacterium]
MKRKTGESKKIEAGGWLTTYADLMNNLLVFFILLYMMSVMDLEKFQMLISSFNATFKGETTETSIAGGLNGDDDLSYEISIDSNSENSEDESLETSSDEDNILDDLDKFVAKITTIIKEKGFQDQIIVEKVDEYVYFRFSEGVLFEPNKAILKDGSYIALDFIAEILIEAYDEISSIEIAGHTAWVPIDELDSNFSSWELSADRAMTVLKFLVQNCDLDKEKMTVMGFSSTQPYRTGDTEEDKQLNRRVEIRISRLIDD